tara:strand:- start:1995 stop:3044 length:1050 start_codon:yes stop_codon:yes gene_type:complete
MESYYQRTVFVESGVNRIGDGIDASWTNNDGTLSVQGNDKFLKMTLQTLSLHRTFYTINFTNNRFYIKDAAAFLTAVIIPDGEYATFTLLAAAIQTAIGVAIPALIAVTVVYDVPSRKFVFDVAPAGAAWTAAHEWLFFCDPSNTADPLLITNAQKGPYGPFNDSYLICGAQPNRSAQTGATIIEGLEKDAAVPTTYRSFYPALLGSLDEIVVRCQTPGVNLSSYGYDVSTGSAQGNNASLVPSNILARIPIRETTYFAPTAYIQYIGDGDETFQMLLGVKSLTNLRLVLTDSRGRPIPQANVDQAKLGCLSFRASLRIDFLQSVLPQTSRVLQPQDIILQQKINLGQE